MLSSESVSDDSDDASGDSQPSMVSASVSSMSSALSESAMAPLRVNLIGEAGKRCVCGGNGKFWDNCGEK